MQGPCPTNAVTEAAVEQEIAPTAGLVVVPWRDGLPVTVLAPKYRHFWA